MEIEKDITTGFVGAGKDFTASLRNQLEEETESSIQIMGNITDQNFSIDSERERTAMILSQIAQSISNINLAVNGEELSVSEIRALAGEKPQDSDAYVIEESSWMKIDTDAYAQQYEKMLSGD